MRFSRLFLIAILFASSLVQAQVIQPGWSEWERFGDGDFIGSPAVTSWGSRRLDVFVIRQDRQVWHKWFNGGWSGWESLGGIGTSLPKAVSWGSRRIDLFVLGTDWALYHRAFTGSGWTDWESLGGNFPRGEISVTSRRAGTLDVFVKTSQTGPINHRSYSTAAGWSFWGQYNITTDSIPLVVGPIAVADPTDGSIDLVIGSSNNRFLKRKFGDPGGWSAFIVPSRTANIVGPAACHVNTRLYGNSLAASVIAENVLFGETRTGGRWSNIAINRPVYTAPVCISWGRGRIDVFSNGDHYGLVHAWYNE